MGSRSRQQLEDWVNVIDVKADSVIDIGGSQLPIKDRVNNWEVKDYKIFDLAQPHEEKQQPDIIGDIQAIDIMKIRSGQFDVAFCLEVSEYWYDPFQALKNIAYLLKQGGILYISFHFIYPFHNPPEFDYLRYTKAGAEKLLKEAGFEIVFNRTRLMGKPGYDKYMEFISKERLRPSRIYTHHNETGYLIEAKKI